MSDNKPYEWKASDIPLDTMRQKFELLRAYTESLLRKLGEEGESKLEEFQRATRDLDNFLDQEVASNNISKEDADERRGFIACLEIDQLVPYVISHVGIWTHIRWDFNPATYKKTIEENSISSQELTEKVNIELSDEFTRDVLER